jgi:hypothetical protein
VRPEVSITSHHATLHCRRAKRLRRIKQQLDSPLATPQHHSITFCCVAGVLSGCAASSSSLPPTSIQASHHLLPCCHLYCAALQACQAAAPHQAAA